MIGKPEWFTRKKIGWGITPATWQGWLYILCFYVTPPLAIFYALPTSQQGKIILIIAWVLIIIIDAIKITLQVPKRT